MLFRQLMVVIEAKLFHYLLIFLKKPLIKYRVLVEVEYFIALREADVPQLAKIDKSIYDSLRAIYKTFQPKMPLD